MRRALLDLLRRLKPVLTLRGLVAAPGAISLCGVGLAAATIFLDRWAPDLAAERGFSADVSRAVFGALAGAAMTALGLVYSITLVVFTLAAGSIAPRLLERFASDRWSQIAIGALGALFLHALISLAFAPANGAFAPVWAALGLAALSVLLLLLFVDRVAHRVTIDEEIAAIAEGLDRRLRAAAAIACDARRDELVPPGGGEAPIRAPVSGYLNRIDMEAIARFARERSGFVDFLIPPGEAVFEGDVVARALGADAAALAEEARAACDFGRRRTEEGDLRFSVNLLLEIAIRALSPGVNDSFTAIAVIDRLAASLALGAEVGYAAGVVADRTGAPRVATPEEGLEALIDAGFGPIRRACRDNLLVAGAALAALRRLEPKLEGAAKAAAARQGELILAEVAAGPALESDIEALKAR